MKVPPPGSRRSASLMATQEELLQLLLRRDGERETRKSGFLATKAGESSGSESLVVLRAFVAHEPDQGAYMKGDFSFSLIPQMLMAMGEKLAFFFFF